MGIAKLELNAKITPVTKSISQDKINGFESLRLFPVENSHNSPELAKELLGLPFAWASGRQTLIYVTEAVRKFFGPEVFSTSQIKIKYLVPVKPGDTITVYGDVSELQPVEKGTKVTVNVYCENQNGAKTAVGVATAVVP